MLQHEVVHTGIIVSKHADKRVRERMGIKRSAVERTVRKAWLAGIDVRAEDGLAERRKLWGNFVFVFRDGPCGPVCVTVLRKEASEEERIGKKRYEPRRERADERRHVRRRFRGRKSNWPWWKV